jgi:hypothetical protein
MGHSSRVVGWLCGALCGWEAVAEWSEGVARGCEGLGRFGGICELRADAGRGGEVLVLFTVSPLTAQVLPELRAESGERFECARGGLGEGLDRCAGIIAVVAVAGRGGEDCFFFIVFPA